MFYSIDFDIIHVFLLQYFNMFKTVRIIVKDTFGRVLLLKKGPDSKNPNQYELPGGKVEEDENDLEAAKFELLEETGIEADELLPFDNFPSYQYEFEIDGHVNNRHVYYYVYEVKNLNDFENNLAITIGKSYREDKHSDYLFVDYENFLEIQDQLSNNSRVALEHYFFYDTKSS